MTTFERKRKLKLQIDLSSEATLDKIEKILKQEKIELPQFIIDGIEKSREQYKNGEFLTEEEAEKDFKKKKKKNKFCLKIPLKNVTKFLIIGIIEINQKNLVKNCIIVLLNLLNL